MFLLFIWSLFGTNITDSLAFYHFQFIFKYIYICFPGSSADKELACDAGDPGSIPGLGRSPGEGIGYLLQYSWDSLVAQPVKNLPAVWETWVWSLGWEDLLEEGMTTHSSILTWRIPTDRGASRATDYEAAKSQTWLNHSAQGTATLSRALAWRIPTDYTVYGVTERQTRLRDFHFTICTFNWKIVYKCTGRETEMHTHAISSPSSALLGTLDYPVTLGSFLKHCCSERCMWCQPWIPTYLPIPSLTLTGGYLSGEQVLGLVSLSLGALWG